MKNEMKTNPSCDLISRADAIEAIASAEPKDNEYHYYKHIAIKILSEIPSIKVEQTQAEKCDECIHKGTRKDKITCKECVSAEAVQGEWIGYNADKEDWLRIDGTPIFLVCDKCHGTVINNGSAHWNFCPNCGAKMKGGEDKCRQKTGK